MITDFKIGTLYIVRNPSNTQGITNGSYKFVPNGTLMLLLDIVQETFANKDIVRDRFIYYFWNDDKIWHCNAYYFDFVNYFDEVNYDQD